jgi:vancomycin resistance protein YoaR
MPKELTNLALNINLKHLTVLGGLVGVLVLVNLIALTLSIKYDGETYPGLMVTGRLLGGLSEAQATQRVAVLEKDFLARKLVITAQGTQIELNLSSLVTYDPKKTALKALAFGRTGDVFEVWKDRTKALSRQEDMTVAYTLNETQLTSVLSDVTNRIGSNGSDARIEINNGHAEIIPEKTGVKVDGSKLREELMSRIAKLSNAPISISTTIVKPEITSSDLQTAKGETDNALKSPVTLVWEGKTWTIGPDQVFNLLNYSAPDQETVTAQVGINSLGVGRIRKLTAGNEPTGNLEPRLSYDSGKLGVILGSIVNSINQPATDPKLAFVDGKLQVAAGSGEGRLVDEKLLSTKVMAALSGQGPKTVDIPIQISQSGIDIAHLESLGIRELLGKGQSFYSGSIPGRNKNIAVASAKVNGALIAPGQTFSLYKQIGEVTPESGYVTSYVIIGHRTELGLGGGVCQVSTTLFRGALSSGLPIVERHPHSYRVHYYEQNSGPGLDATVYFPDVDFKFRNDTGHWILIQTVNDPAHSSLTFEFYGTSDGRVTTISTPEVTNVQPAPAPLYQDDPSLPKGIKKQVDWAVEGADASFTRTVARDGKAILNDTYYSKYSPWQAVYMVGTKG